VIALSALRPSRRLLALLLALFAIGAVIPAATPVPASAQSQTLIQPPQTKEEAAKAEKAADAAADDGGGVSLVVWMIIAATIVIGGAAYFIFRDAGTVANVDERRAGPKRPPVEPTKVRGAPQTMFAGDAAPGGKVGRNKKREKSKRQKAARRNNRPGR
jgi:hypothetical protein